MSEPIPEDILAKAREIDAVAYRNADRIARAHTVKGFFESISNWTARKIRLRTDIYNAYVAERTANAARVAELEAGLRKIERMETRNANATVKRIIAEVRALIKDGKDA